MSTEDLIVRSWPTVRKCSSTGEKEWENFYNLSRPHGAFAGKTPYEVMRAKLC